MEKYLTVSGKFELGYDITDMEWHDVDTVVKSGNEELIKFLYVNNITAYDKQYGVLEAVIDSSNCAIVKLLCSLGAEVVKKCFIQSAYKNKQEIIDYMYYSLNLVPPKECMELACEIDDYNMITSLFDCGIAVPKEYVQNIIEEKNYEGIEAMNTLFNLPVDKMLMDSIADKRYDMVEFLYKEMSAEISQHSIDELYAKKDKDMLDFLRELGARV